MLKAILNQLTHKSIDELNIGNLPNFMVLTGVNGAGKTHFLTGITNQKIFIYYNDQLINNLNTSDCKYVACNTLVPADSVLISPEHIKQTIDGFFDQYNTWIINSQQNNQLIENYINENQLNIINHIAEKSKKNKLTLNSEDFHSHYPIHDNAITDAFQNNLSSVFKRYHTKWLDNKFQKFLDDENPNDGIKYYTDIEFNNLNGDAPWKIINDILEVAKLDFRINYPTANTPRESQFEATLINIDSKIEIKFSELSSGEKVLISLALAQYNLENNYVAPKLLILDEPDASLHPSMVKQFLDVIEQIFVIKKGIKVIITTHSPTTVALANEESLYLMNKTNPRIEKVSKDKALEVLTIGLPSFSINYENRRQVFVEDQNDVGYYEELYKKLKPKLIDEISLNFISAGDSRANNNGQPVTGCDQVKKITNILTNCGNKFIKGLIDWDLKNEDKNSVIVLGNSRYAIENYLFDPILITALLIREKKVEIGEVGLSSNNIVDFKNYDNNTLQTISNWLVSKVQQGSDTNFEMVEVEYCNNSQIKIPKWYLIKQGHELEEQIKKTFPKINELAKKENDLKTNIIKKVVDDIPELIPKDILDVFIKLQS